MAPVSETFVTGIRHYLVVNIEDVVQLDDMWVVQHFHDVQLAR